MKKNFIVSHLKELWIREPNELFISDPYIYYLIKQNNEELNYKNIEVAEFLRTNRKQMDEAIDFIQQKYNKYIPILAKRFNEIHNTTYTEEFWKKCLSLAFYRYLTVFHDMFSRCEKYFNSEEHCCQVLSERSYYIPIDFEDHFRLTATTHFGQEQIFSHYIKLFYPKQFSDIDLKQEDSSSLSFQAASRFRILKYCCKAVKLLMLLKFKEIFIKACAKISNRINKNNTRSIKIGILNAFFSGQHINTLIEKSNGAIQYIEVERLNQNMYNVPINWNNRKLLGIFEKDFDRFDKFIFYTFPYCMPRTFMENFEAIYKANVQRINKIPQLKYVVGEAWQSNTYDSMAMAIMNEEKGVKHIYNEHNGFTHCFTGKLCYQKANLVDYFVTVGWYNDSIPKLVKGASLFPFVIKNTCKKQYQLLYVTNSSEARMYHYGGLYGTMEVNALEHLEFAKIFMANLDYDNLKKLAYRRHPKVYSLTRLVYDSEDYLKEYLSDVQILPASGERGETCKEQMCKSRLVVVDSLSTAYLEAMSMNIPTIFFWNPKKYYLDDGYPDFFQPLINAGICQTNPVEAARFVDKIIDNPDKWWFSESVQAGRKSFFDKNFGEPEVMLNYLLSLAKTN